MEFVKPAWFSRTNITAVLGIMTTLPFAAKYFGGWDIGQLSELLAALAPPLFGLVAYFRTIATKELVVAGPAKAEAINNQKMALMAGNALGSADEVTRRTTRYPDTGLLPVLFLVALLPLLTACVTPGGNTTSFTPAVGANRVDVVIANTSEQVSQYCGVLRFGVGVGQWFAKSEKHQQYVAYAQSVVAAYCDQPPTDVITALQTMQTAYRNIMTVPAVNTAVRESSLRLPS